MNGMLDAAVGYAQRGWHVFPLHGIGNGRCTCGRADCSSPGKHPVTRHGLKDATRDRGLIESWWRRWGRANIGVATGDASGIVVIDVDLPRAYASLHRVVHKLPRTLTGLTGGGGVHLLYRGGVHLLYRAVSGALRCTCSRLPGIKGDLPGIDLRADGGYVVAPPSRHISGSRYAWLNLDVPIADAPAWLKEDPRRLAPAMPPSAPKFSSGDGTAYGRAALENALTSLRHAPVGQRNHTLNRVAFGLAQLVAAGHLSESAARAALLRVALQVGLSEFETARTIESAFAAGLQLHREPGLVS